ncbi:hypothetical protein ACFWHQ_14865 [Streptomyces sp. NPDC060334]|uniref:hypothetical protein n=1 Tax=Streptomyces sp. NPDC060334 TaxID=3347099 RepID=UPI003668429B
MCQFGVAHVLCEVPADLVGMLLPGLAIVLILFPLTEGHAHGWPLWCFVVVAACVLVLGVFLCTSGVGRATPRW